MDYSVRTLLYSLVIHLLFLYAPPPSTTELKCFALEIVRNFVRSHQVNTAVKCDELCAAVFSYFHTGESHR